MHDLDQSRGQFETNLGGQEMGFGAGETGSNAFESNLFESEFPGEVYGEAETSYFGQGEVSLNEAQEYELAAELLSVRDEAELEQFLGNLIRGAGRALGGLAKNVLPRLGGVLKGIASTALPIVGRVAGTMLGGPAGGMIGGQLASAAGSLFGLELEGLSAEDREFEVARRYVRFANAAVRNLARAPQSASPDQIVRNAVAAAARQYAPGLLRMGADTLYGGGNFGPQYGGGTSGAVSAAPATGLGCNCGAGGSSAMLGAGQRVRSGRWIRRGNKIILFGS